MRRRHPSSAELAAWLVGEAAPDVCMHVLRCRRCSGTLARLGQARAVRRGEPAPPAAGRRPHWASALVAGAAAVALLVGATGIPGRIRPTPAGEAAGAPSQAAALPVPGDALSPLPAAGPGAEPAAGPDPSPAGAEPTGAAASGDVRRPRPVAGPAADAVAEPPVPAATAAPVVPATAGAPSRGAPEDGMRAGVPVPVHGPDAAEGHEVVRAVRAAAALAAEKGAGGRPVHIVVVPVDDDAARRVALARVDVLVGGFAMPAPPGLPWLVPADSGVDGPDVVSGETTPGQAGDVLGADLARRADGAVGAVTGGGADGLLADGLALHVRVDRVAAAPGTSCDREVAALRRARVAALAVAGPPELARRCLEAAGRLRWRPPGGVLVAPSAAYAGLERSLSAQGARTARGFPTPLADEPGARRYRQVVPGSRAYRALVSFAAAEMLLDVVRATGEISAQPVRAGHWRSDLYDLDAGRNLSARVVSARLGRWVADGGAG